MSMRVKIQVLTGVILVLACASRSLAAEEPSGVSIEVTAKTINFLVRGELLTRYHIGAEVAKPYFWPINAPGGVSLTRAWPMERAKPGESTDHTHQKSAWFGHGDVIPEGIAVPPNKVRKIAGIDFWTEEPAHGLMVCTERGKPLVTGNHGQIATHNEWRSAQGQKILDEERVIHLYDLGARDRLLVVEIDLHASVVPITFGDTDEGTMGVRISDSLAEQARIGTERRKGSGRLQNAEGKAGEKACWGMVSAWSDYSGPIAGEVLGLALLSDPANTYPSCWQSRSYGLMAANPFGRDHSGYPAMKGRTDLARLPRGEHLKLRYGILIHPGDAVEGKVAEHYQQFVKRR
jgi:hypothetical protein